MIPTDVFDLLLVLFFLYVVVWGFVVQPVLRGQHASGTPRAIVVVSHGDFMSELLTALQTFLAGNLSSLGARAGITMPLRLLCPLNFLALQTFLANVASGMT